MRVAFVSRPAGSAVGGRGFRLPGSGPLRRAPLGLGLGDLIVQINRRAVGSAEEAATLLKRLAGHGPARAVLERQGRYGTTSFYITR